MTKLPYVEGSVFTFPLRDAGYARGIVARSGPDGYVLFGYFFGPRLAANDNPSLEDLHPDKALLRVRFGDLCLVEGKWRVVGTLPKWNRAEWTMPDFVRREAFSERAWIVRYSDIDPNDVESETRTDCDSNLGRDVLMGCGSVEIAMTRLLGKSQNET